MIFRRKLAPPSRSTGSNNHSRTKYKQLGWYLEIRGDVILIRGLQPGLEVNDIDLTAKQDYIESDTAE
jgi:hypothetical protein